MDRHSSTRPRHGKRGLQGQRLPRATLALVAILALACDGRPTGIDGDGYHIVLDFSGASNASLQAVGPVATTATLFWRNSKGTQTLVQPVVDNRAAFTLAKLPKENTAFWASGSSGNATVLYWSAETEEDIEENFDVRFTLAPIFPLPDAIPLSRSVQGSNPLIADLSAPTVTVTLRNNRANSPILDAAVAAGHPVLMNWSVIENDLVTITPSSGVLAPDSTVDLTIEQKVLADTAIATEILLEYNFGADTLTTELVLLREPGVLLSKLTNADTLSRYRDSLRVFPGSDVTWTYLIKNTGTVDLTIAEVGDSLMPPGGPDTTISIPDSLCTASYAEPLMPGDSLMCSVTGSAVLGSYKNVGFVDAKSGFGDTVASDSSFYFSTGIPVDTTEVGGNLTLRVLINNQHHPFAPGPSIPVNAPTNWRYIVTNSGPVTLTDIIVRDDQQGQICGPLPDLAPNVVTECSKQGVAALGQYGSVGRATGRDPQNRSVTTSDLTHHRGVIIPSVGIDIEKSTNGVDADTGPGPLVTVGSSVTWTYVVTNTGNVPLTNVDVLDSDPGVDPRLPPGTGSSPLCLGLTLQPGASVTCQASGLADVVILYGNLGTATGMALDGTSVMAADSSHFEAR